jgi:dethiobiotin synthetase
MPDLDPLAKGEAFDDPRSSSHSPLGFLSRPSFHPSVAEVLFITGSDTGVGKTSLSVALTRWLVAQAVNVRAVKPFCSGGRDDALALCRAQIDRLTIDEVNPWYFRDPLAPLLAARNEGKSVVLDQALSFLHAHAAECDVLIVEGAGGLLSPLLENADALTFITELSARPIVVCPNRLGAINQSLLVWRSLPPGLAVRGRLVLMAQPEPDTSAPGNTDFLVERIGKGRVVQLPWIKGGMDVVFGPALPRILGSELAAILSE